MNHNLRRFVVPTGLAAVAVLLPATAHAASPEPEKFSSSETVTVPDYCGTGEEVTITFSVKGVDFHDPNRGEFASVFQSKETITFEDRTVVGHSAGRFTDTILEGEEGGAHTHAFTVAGLPQQFRIEGGGVLTRDAGKITFIVAIDENGEVTERVITRGPHPEADSGFTRSCEVITEALGIGQP